MKKTDVKGLVLAAVIAALYAVLTLAASSLSITYGPVQLRVSEALCVLPYCFPGTIWGLFVGCMVANLLSPYGLLDIVIGSFATLLAAFCTSRLKRKWLAPLPPVIINGLLIGALIAWYESAFTPAFLPAFAYNGLTVALGELGACYILGLPLLHAMYHIPFFRARIAPGRLEY